MVLLFAALISKRLGEERNNDCIFVVTYLFNMFPGKRESFAFKHFGNIPSESPSLNLILGTLEFFFLWVQLQTFILRLWSSLQNNLRPSGFVSLQYSILITKTKSRFLIFVLQTTLSSRNTQQFMPN